MEPFQRASLALVHYLYHTKLRKGGALDGGDIQVISLGQDDYYKRYYKIKKADSNGFDIVSESPRTRDYYRIYTPRMIDRDQITFETEYDRSQQIIVEHFLPENTMGNAGSDRFQSKIVSHGRVGQVEIEDFAKGKRKFKYEIEYL